MIVNLLPYILFVLHLRVHHEYPAQSRVNPPGQIIDKLYLHEHRIIAIAISTPSPAPIIAHADAAYSTSASIGTGTGAAAGQVVQSCNDIVRRIFVCLGRNCIHHAGLADGTVPVSGLLTGTIGIGIGIGITIAVTV